MIGMTRKFVAEVRISEITSVLTYSGRFRIRGRETQSISVMSG